MADKVVAFDAMGVLYLHGDDVVDLLIPYAREQDYKSNLYERSTLTAASKLDGGRNS